MVPVEVTRLLLEYRNIVSSLRDLGVIRTSKVVGEIGEYIVCDKLNLNRNKSSGNKGYDATDDEGNKYEIKTRKATSWNKPNMFPVKQLQLETADFLLYAELDDFWDLIKLLRIPIKQVKPNKHNRVVLNKELIQRYSILED